MNIFCMQNFMLPAAGTMFDILVSLTCTVVQVAAKKQATV